MSATLVANVRAVLPGRIAEDATVAFEDGTILSVEEGSRYRGALDGRGAFCLPGLIDSHSDAIEREIFPRRTVRLDVAFALRCLEARFVAAGVTTAFHGVNFGDYGQARTVEMAVEIAETIGERRKQAIAPLHHRVLFRIPARNKRGLAEALSHLGTGQDSGDVPVMSFEDHTPGQGQFRDLAKLKEAIDPDELAPGEDLDTLLARKMEEAEKLLPSKIRNREKLSALAIEGAARVLAHDAQDAEEVAQAHGWGAAVAEFPVSLEAAAAARKHQMPVVMGAPNALRGASHSGNVSAEELVAKGLCTGLASDYLPASLLASVFGLAGRGICSLPEAVRLVTAGPAEVVGLEDRGRLERGLRADLVLVEMDGRWPSVRWSACQPSPEAQAVQHPNKQITYVKETNETGISS